MAESKRGRWKPGESGNLKGRPPGTGGAAKLRAAIQNDLPEILEAMARAAKGGDVQAARVLLDRVLPALKPETTPINLPELGAGTLVQRAEAVMRAVGNGELSHDAGAALVGAVAAVARIAELTELEARLTALESRMEGKP